MGPADRSERPPDAARGRRGFRLDAETFGIGALLAAVGICCATTLAVTGLGAGIIVTVVGVLAGLGWLAPLLTAVGLVGIVWFRARRRRGRLATDRPHATGRVR
jgi:hypothetical protein